MELLFLSHSVYIELIIIGISWAIALVILLSYLYGFIQQLREIFGPKKRDAVMSRRDTDTLKKRSLEEEKDEEIDDMREETTPPPIILEELENVEAIDPHILESLSAETPDVPASSEPPQTEAFTTSRETTEDPHAHPEESREKGSSEKQHSENTLKEAHPEDLSEKASSQSDDRENTHPSEVDLTTENTPPPDTSLDKLDTPIKNDDTTERMKVSTQEKETSLENDSPQEVSEDILKAASTKISLPIESVSQKKKSHPQSESLLDITNQAKTLFARGKISEARAAITSGLALKKDHRDLNLLLWEIYESEKRYPQAEIVYKDLALIYPEDQDILERLANTLIIMKNYPIAYEIYKKIAHLWGNTENTLFILINVAHELGNTEEVFEYAKKYLKSYPNNKDILALMAEAEIALGKRKEAIQTLIKLKNLSPYDADAISEMIAKLVAEEEMAENFWTHTSDS